ncbi:hypothetical protein ACOSQ4_021688 [Xanthoceras sorbifolium]
MEELNNILEHAKQRHHMIGQYVVGHHGLVQDLESKDQGLSDFLKNFYKSNYFWNFIVPQTGLGQGGGLNGKTLDLLEICCHLKAIYMMNMRSREIHWTMSLSKAPVDSQ